MRSKSPLALMEQVVMVLVFALAAALCLRVFVFSDQASGRNEAVDRAVLEAQNAAETIKSAGDIGGLKETMGAQIDDQAVLAVYYDEEWKPASVETAAYRLLVKETDADVSGLRTAEITVDDGTGENVLFSIPVAWQEVSGNE